MNRRIRRQLDSDQWPAFDVAALPDAQRKAFLARRQAVELYAAGATVASIEETAGVVRCELYRLLDRCVTAHEDGRLYGWRALVPYVHVAEYQRVHSLVVRPNGAGAAGAFGALVERFPAITEWIEKQVHAKKVTIDRVTTGGALRMRLRGLKALHADFLKLCRALGLTAGDYPFNTERLAIRSLAAAVRGACVSGFARSAHLAGAQHLKGTPKDPWVPAATQALEVVEFDGHRLDVRLKVVVRDPLGFEQEFEIERIWLLVIIDVFSRAVLGYHVSLNREYNRYDVIRTIEAALEPHRPRAFTLPGVGYGPL
ncbi:MAG: transposase family protein, partial [Zoogloea sp.]|nr:transposase family protein [Zoogloea sp.]